MIEPWEEISRELKGDYEVFRVHRTIRRSPRTGGDHPFHLIESVDWVNVIPVTPDGKLVMIEQYRHGSQAVTLEIPGGMIDDSDPSPAAAAQRELTEETGYHSDRIEFLGAISPNPAVQTNKCYSFLARNVLPIQDPELDHAEDIAVRLIDHDEVPRLIAEGKIDHSLVVTAFYLYAHHSVRALSG